MASISPWQAARETEIKLHLMTDVRTIAHCAVIGGANPWDGIAEFGTTKQASFRRFLPRSNGNPGPDTFCTELLTHKGCFHMVSG